MEEMISVGKILNFHGILGTAKAGYSNAEVIKNLKTVYFMPNGRSDGEKTALTVQDVKFHKNFALIKFKEINSIDELLPYKGQNIYIRKDIAKNSLGDDEFLIDDLIGMNAFDNEDELIGQITDVKSSSGNDILCIKPAVSYKGKEDGAEILVPFAKELVPIVDIKAKKVVIKPIEGLLE